MPPTALHSCWQRQHFSKHSQLPGNVVTREFTSPREFACSAAVQLYRMREFCYRVSDVRNDIGGFLLVGSYREARQREHRAPCLCARQPWCGGRCSLQYTSEPIHVCSILNVLARLVQGCTDIVGPSRLRFARNHMCSLGTGDDECALSCDRTVNLLALLQLPAWRQCCFLLQVLESGDREGETERYPQDVRIMGNAMMAHRQSRAFGAVMCGRKLAMVMGLRKSVGFALLPMWKPILARIYL